MPKLVGFRAREMYSAIFLRWVRVIKRCVRICGGYPFLLMCPSPLNSALFFWTSILAERVGFQMLLQLIDFCTGFHQICETCPNLKDVFVIFFFLHASIKMGIVVSFCGFLDSLIKVLKIDSKRSSRTILLERGKQ